MSISRNILPRLIALAFVLGLILAMNTGRNTVMGQTTEVNRIPNGQKMKKVKGIVSKRDGDIFTMGETMGGAQTVVLMTSATEAKSHKRGAFRGSKDYGQTYILRGLRVEVDGVGNAEGQLVAEKIRFDEQDLRTAQALMTTVDPLEAELRAKLKAQQEEQERLAGQLAETQASVNQARAEAAKAQEDARKAQETADLANNRINGLDDYDPIRTITVYFATGSSVLNAKAKAELDEAAAWAKTQNRKGWAVAVIGYADSAGKTARNRTLSEARANSVIYYLVTKHRADINRLVQPFGYGEEGAAAENKTAEGRAKNRRVEIRLMRNKGIAGT